MEELWDCAWSLNAQVKRKFGIVLGHFEIYFPILSHNVIDGPQSGDLILLDAFSQSHRLSDSQVSCFTLYGAFSQSD